jgi:hypothetical protein
MLIKGGDDLFVILVRRSEYSGYVIEKGKGNYG